MEVITAFPLLIFLGIPWGLPPLPEDKALAAVAPQECLLYASWFGTAQADAASKNHVERLLAEPEVRHCLATLWKELEAAARRVGPTLGGDGEALMNHTIPLVDILLTRPGCAFVTKVELPGLAEPGEGGFYGGAIVEGGLVVHAGPRLKQLQSSIAFLEELVIANGAARGAGAKDVTIDGVKLREMSFGTGAPKVTLGFHGEYLVIAVGEKTAEQMIAGLKGPRGPPDWLKLARERLAVERPAGVLYLNTKGVADLIINSLGREGRTVQFVLDTLGLNNVQSLATVNGLDETHYVSKTFLAVRGEPRGLLTLLGDRPLTAADLSAVPRKAAWAFVARFDAAKAYLRGWEMVPGGGREEIEGRLEAAAGFRLLEDLLEPLGDSWAVYHSGGEGGPLGVTLAIDVEDRAPLQKVNRSVQALLGRGEGDDEPPRLTSFQHASETVHVVHLGGGVPLAPSWCLTEKKLFVALYPQSIKAQLSRAAGAGSLADSPDAAAALKERPIALAYLDTADVVRTAYPVLQAMAPLAARELRGLGLKVDASLLPSGKAIYPHLQPTVSWIARREEGLLMVSRQTLPGGGLATVAPLMAAPATLFWLRAEASAPPPKVKAERFP